MSQPCLNCGTIYHDAFCAHCGQKAGTKRITFHALLHDIPHSVLHIDKGFFYTLTQLLKRPGHAIHEYIEGKRVNHYKPLGYLIILSAASTVLSHLAASYAEHFRNAQIGLSSHLFSTTLAVFFEKFPALMFCCMVPFMSLWSFLFNRHSGYNYAENLVLNIYLIAQFNLFIILNTLVMLALGKTGGSVTPMLTVFFLYTAFVYTHFFKKRKLLSTVLMYIALVLTVITALSVCGFMTPWWGVRVG